MITKDNLEFLASLQTVEATEHALYSVRHHLIELARLGLWAKEHGIPTLENYAQYSSEGAGARHTLESLPKDSV